MMPDLAGSKKLGQTDAVSEQVEKQKEKPFFENLDTLRFISFMLVFLFHVGLYDYVASFTSQPLLLGLVRVLSSGGWGVTFFFALSGFLITWLLLVEVRKKGKVNVGAFYMRRVLRIWPLYALVIFTGLVVLPFLYKMMGQPLHFDYPVWLYATFLSNFGVISLNPALDSIRSFPLVLNITWSVSIEEQFYVVWPLCFLIRPQWYRYIPVFFILFSFGFACYYFNDFSQLYSSSLTRIGEIAIGAWFAYQAFHSKRFLAFFTNINRYLILAIYAAAGLLIYSSFHLHGLPINTYVLHMLGAVLFSCIILEQNFARHSLLKFGRFKVMGFLGKISYGLYMLHPIAMFASSFLLQKLLHAGSPVASGPAFMLLSFALTIVIAWLSFYLYERPFLRLKKLFAFGGHKTGGPMVQEGNKVTALAEVVS